MIWEDPPEFVRTYRWTERFIIELQKHPGKWARVPGSRPDGSQGAPTFAKLRAAGCDVVTQRTDDPSPARYIGWARWPTDMPCPHPENEQQYQADREMWTCGTCGVVTGAT